MLMYIASIVFYSILLYFSYFRYILFRLILSLLISLCLQLAYHIDAKYIDTLIKSLLLLLLLLLFSTKETIG